MTLNEKLRFLELSKEFDVEHAAAGKEYLVSLVNEASIVACIKEDGEVNYYVIGVYNSCSNFAEIDMKELKKLQEYVEFLTKIDNMQ